MYSDGDRKTISELQRTAAALRKRILDESAQLERVQKAITRREQTIDQLFSLFAREVDVTDRDAFMCVITSLSEDIDISKIPLLPIVITLANGYLSSVKRLHATRSRFVDDSSVIFLAHVLRFSPSVLQVELLDISGTKVTEKGLFFLLEMMSERETPFVLIAENRTPPDVAVEERYKKDFEALLPKVRGKQNCTLIL